MTEQLANSVYNPTAQLSVGIDASVTSLTVSDVSEFIDTASAPLVGAFRVMVWDGATDASKEIIKVGAFDSGTGVCSSLTRAVEGKNAAQAHAAGDLVELVISAGGLEQYVSDHSGGGLSYALIQLENPPDPLTPLASRYLFQESDLSIAYQTDDDFSIGSYTDMAGNPASGAVLSARGGSFQVGAFLGEGSDTLSLDAGSTQLRFLHMGIRTGDDVEFGLPNLSSLGLDLLVPVTEFEVLHGSCASSTPGVTSAGGPAAYQFFVRLLNGTGTDSVTADMFGWPLAVVWRIK